MAASLAAVLLATPAGGFATLAACCAATTWVFLIDCVHGFTFYVN